MEAPQQPTVQSLLERLKDPGAVNDLEAWEQERRRFGFERPIPTPPPPHPEPKAPSFKKAPHEDDPPYEVTLSMIDRLLGRGAKKRQSALRRFEKARKAWDEDRLNALAVYEMASKRYVEKHDALETAYQAAMTEWKKAFAAFLQAGDRPAT